MNSAPGSFTARLGWTRAVATGTGAPTRDNGRVIRGAGAKAAQWKSREPTDAARAPTEATSKFWGVSWDKSERRWKAGYTDANGKTRHIGYFDTQEQAAHAVNAAIRRAGLGGRRKTNPVVDGQLVPRARKAPGHGCDALRKRPRGVDPAAPPRRSARRSRQE